MKYYKVARPDGFDFHTEKTINYRDNIGKTVKCPNQTKSNNLCSNDVIHASELFIDALGYGELPCSIFIVSGKPVKKDKDKCGFKSFKIIREVNTSHWKQAYYSFMIWMLEDLKNNFDNKKNQQVTDAINQTIQVFVNAQKTGKIDKSAAASAWSVVWSAESAARLARSAEKKQLSEKFIELLELSEN